MDRSKKSRTKPAGPELPSFEELVGRLIATPPAPRMQKTRKEQAKPQREIRRGDSAVDKKPGEDGG